MPFDDRTFPSAEAALLRRNRRRVAWWLFSVAGLIYGMVVLGGATRLTGSGLSIMEWAPISGTFPPLSDTEWNRLFGLYQHIPQYTLLHPDMTLAGFKQIFWLEYFHRLLGRLLGMVFALPFLFFSLTGAIERRMVPRLALLFGLGALQGAVGWFMVSSGFFPDSTSVSATRLVIHLSLALTLYSAVIWAALTTLSPIAQNFNGGTHLKHLAKATVCIVALTILAGGYTAGLHAGLTYNSFPLMDGRLFPAGYATLSPFWHNLTQNVTAVQFNHRLLATFTLFLVTVTVATGIRQPNLPRPAAIALAFLGGAMMMQYGLGIATLLSVVALPLAVMHQACAVLLLTATLGLAHSLRGALK